MKSDSLYCVGWGRDSDRGSEQDLQSDGGGVGVWGRKLKDAGGGGVGGRVTGGAVLSPPTRSWYERARGVFSRVAAASKRYARPAVRPVRVFWIPTVSGRVVDP